ncbi:MAG: hypothetical protein AB2L13_11985 [Spirochaetota bacterium]
MTFTTATSRLLTRLPGEDFVHALRGLFYVILGDNDLLLLLDRRRAFHDFLN